MLYILILFLENGVKRKIEVSKKFNQDTLNVQKQDIAYKEYAGIISDKQAVIENVKTNTQNDTKINTNRNSFDIGNGNQADIFDNRYYISDNDNVEMNNIEEIQKEEPKKIIVDELSKTSNIEKGNFYNE